LKVVVIAFFVNEGIVHHEFVPGGTTVNAVYGVEGLSHLQGKLEENV
jgi:hypothetical protein